MGIRANYISLYSGVGGLDLAFRMAVPTARTVCYVERDAASIEILVSHMQAGELGDAPIWTDSGTFDGTAWRGHVDWIIGGFPCQPASVAGARKGLDDERWLWPHIARIVDEVRPSGIFLENVPGLLTVNDGAAFREVVGDLAALGFDAEWGCVRASDVGAPHKRERLFILAHRNGQLSDVQQRGAGPESDRSGKYVANTRGVSGQVSAASESNGANGRALASAGGNGQQQLAHTTGDGRKARQTITGSEAAVEGPPGEWKRTGNRSESTDGKLGNADGERRWQQGDSELPSGRLDRPELPLWPPGPSDAEGWRRVLAADPTLEPAIRDVADGPTAIMGRVDQLRMLGNAVVPPQAAHAFGVLMDRHLQNGGA